MSAIHVDELNPASSAPFDEASLRGSKHRSMRKRTREEPDDGDGDDDDDIDFPNSKGKKHSMAVADAQTRALRRKKHNVSQCGSAVRFGQCLMVISISVIRFGAIHERKNNFIISSFYHRRESLILCLMHFWMLFDNRKQRYGVGKV